VVLRKLGEGAGPAARTYPRRSSHTWVRLASRTAV